MRLQPIPIVPSAVVPVALPTAEPASSASPVAEQITVSISALRFEGLGILAARRVGSAFERHLVALFERRGLPSPMPGVAREALRLGRLEVDPSLLPERCGEELAERVWRQLSEPRSPNGESG